MSDTLQTAFTAALLVAMLLLVAYQVVMLWWTKRTVGSVPTAVRFLRAFNITVLVLGAALIAWRILRG